MVVTRSASQNAINAQGLESSGRAEKQLAVECMAIPVRQLHSNFDWHQSFWERSATRDGATDPSCPSLYSKTTLDSKTQTLEDPRCPAPRSVRGTNPNELVSVSDQEANPDPAILDLGLARQHQSVVSGTIDGHPSVLFLLPQDASETAHGHEQPALVKAEATQRVDQDGLHSRSLDSYPFSFETLRDSLAAADADEAHTSPEANPKGDCCELLSKGRGESENDDGTDSSSEGELDHSSTPFNSTFSDSPASQQDVPHSPSARSISAQDSASRRGRLVNWLFEHRNIVPPRDCQPKLTTSASYTTSSESTSSGWGFSGFSQSSSSNTGPSRGGEKRQSPTENGNAPGGQGGGDPPKRLRMAKSQGTVLRFACPFQKHDPHASPHCSHPSRRNNWGGYENVNRVRQHVLTCHNKAFFCQRCWRQFPTTQQARQHEEAENCEMTLNNRTDWMRPGQEEEVKKRIASKDPEDRWYTLFERLFPDLPSEGPDSAREKYNPYYQIGAWTSGNCNTSSDESIQSSSAGLILDEPFSLDNPPPFQSMPLEHVAIQEPSNIMATFTTDWQGDWLGGRTFEQSSSRDMNAFNAHNTTNYCLERPSGFNNSASGNVIHDSVMMNLDQVGPPPTDHPPSVQNDGPLTAAGLADLRLHLSDSQDELRRRGSKIDRCTNAYSRLRTCLDDMSDFAIELASNPADENRMRTLNAHIKLMREVLDTVL
ncbi:hypothetical protein EDB81DRAFT_851934 [Dactylonectria macrodidyma]|uniref:C2H2-type domain-containing protein n=1 Tax=Dactylonectria macrodidyma TaxID=307937 RepID=A0A9P9FRL2_9HYPO|nr:hypothetical protein EDB81DRAFT_851934 [Dactylonectria macrodidyma]